MPLNPYFVQDTLPATSAAALREFNDRYLAVLAVAQPAGWADELGDMIPTDRAEVTFPISQLQTKYRRTEETDGRFKTLGEKSFDVKTEEFDDGYSARKMDILMKVFAYRQWQQAPERFVIAEAQHRHNNIALILDGSGTRGGAVGSANDPGGVSRTCIDGTNFFGTTHPINITDATVKRQTDGATTWSNYQASAKNVLGSTATGTSGPFSFDNLQGEVIAGMNQVPDENGQLLGWEPDSIIVANDYKEPLENFLLSERVAAVFTANSGNELAAAGVNNVYRGKYKVYAMKEATQTSGSTADWYLVDSKMLKKGIMPWLSLRQTVDQSLGLRIFDESSDYFKNTGRLKVTSHIWYGFSLALPHAIRRVKGPTR